MAHHATPRFAPYLTLVWAMDAGVWCGGFSTGRISPLRGHDDARARQGDAMIKKIGNLKKNGNTEAHLPPALDRSRAGNAPCSTTWSLRAIGFLLSWPRRDDERPQTPQTRTALRMRASHVQPPREGVLHHNTILTRRGGLGITTRRANSGRGVLFQGCVFVVAFCCRAFVWVVLVLLLLQKRAFCYARSRACRTLQQQGER